MVVKLQDSRLTQDRPVSTLAYEQDRPVSTTCPCRI